MSDDDGQINSNVSRVLGPLVLVVIVGGAGWAMTLVRRRRYLQAFERMEPSAARSDLERGGIVGPPGRPPGSMAWPHPSYGVGPRATGQRPRNAAGGGGGGGRRGLTTVRPNEGLNELGEAPPPYIGQDNDDGSKNIAPPEAVALGTLGQGRRSGSSRPSGLPRRSSEGGGEEGESSAPLPPPPLPLQARRSLPLPGVPEPPAYEEQPRDASQTSPAR